jgi:hypothetical protein
MHLEAYSPAGKSDKPGNTAFVIRVTIGALAKGFCAGLMEKRIYYCFFNCCADFFLKIALLLLLLGGQIRQSSGWIAANHPIVVAYPSTMGWASLK